MGRSTFVYGDSTAEIRTTANGSVPFAEFTTPTIPPFNGNWMLFNGHLQTAWSVVKWNDPFPLHYARRHLTNPRDGGHFTVDFVTSSDTFDSNYKPCGDLPERTRHMTHTEIEKQMKGSVDTQPMVIALHGLTGGSHEMYLRAVLAPLVQDEQMKFLACVLNARGCAMSTITSSQLFNAKFTEDLRLLVKELRRLYPNRPLFAVGFSMGGNILTNYLGEEGGKSLLSAAVVVSNPWNLELADKALHRTYFNHHIYSKALGANLRNLYELEQLHKDTRIDPQCGSRIVHAFDFDREVTVKVFGYQTVGQYYREASSVNNILKVRTPLLVIHARDDPIACEEAIPFDEIKANPWCFGIVTDSGGHLGWFERVGSRWFAKPVAALFKKFALEVCAGNMVTEDGDAAIMSNIEVKEPT